MNIFEGMKSFVRVARSGSFSLAAKQCGVTQSRMSKQIAGLERHLGVQLLSRSTRQLRLTQDGVDYLQFAERILDLIDEAQAHVGLAKATPQGLVRVGSPIMFAAVFLLSKVAALLEGHPLLKFEIVVSDASPNLIEQDLDVAIRFGALSGDVVAKRLGAIRRVVVASPAYVARFGKPDRPEDLAHHQCLLLTVQALGRDWSFTGPQGSITVGIQSRFSSNSSQVIKEACLAGHGIAMLPSWLFAEQLSAGTVRRVLEGFEPESLPASIIYPARENIPLKTRVVTAFLAATLRRELAAMAAAPPGEAVALPGN